MVCLTPQNEQLRCVSAGQEERNEYLTKLDIKTPSGLVVAKSARFTPRALQAGQWVEYLIRDSRNPSVGGTHNSLGGPRSGAELISYKLKVLRAGEFPFSFWIEEELTSAEGVQAARQQVIMDDARLAVANQEPLTFLPTVTDFGKVQEAYLWNGAGEGVSRIEVLDGELVLAKTKFNSIAAAGFEKARKISVKSGTFTGCFDGTSAVRMGGKFGTFRFCADPQVPFSGIVQGQDPPGRSWELVDFGSSGARSIFP